MMRAATILSGALLGVATAAPAQTTLDVPVRATGATTQPRNALAVTQTGQGRAINGVIDNEGNRMAAVRGQTNGRGVALHGASIGTRGGAGKFEITNRENEAPGVTITTQGPGHGLLVTTWGGGYGIYAKQEDNDAEPRGEAAPAIYGENLTISDRGPCCDSVGVAGKGKGIGVSGYGYARAGVFGTSEIGYGVFGISDSNRGVSAESTSGTGLYARSETGLAAEFIGKVTATDTITATGFLVSSDRNLKTDFAPVDGAELLERIAGLEVSRWAYQSEPGVMHVGPMAQDFQAAFGLGRDDRHIEVVDGMGVSLAAIRALVEQLKAKDATIERLTARVQLLETAVSGRQAAQ